MKNKWVFKIKPNYVYRMHFVACGYSQVPGVDFSKNYSQVVNDITFHTLLLIVLYFGYLVEIVDNFLSLQGPGRRNIYGVSTRHVKYAKR